MRVYSFATQLAASHAAHDLPLWEECYRKAWRNFQSMTCHRGSGAHQLAGIDRSVLLTNSTQILIDEKIRGRNRITGKVYDDIALEEWSSIDHLSPGWIQKDLRCQYIAYAIAPLGKCYLLPIEQTQQAWLANCDEWKKLYKRIAAQNQGYTTISWGIPVKVLFPAIGRALRIDFEPCEWEGQS